MSDVDVNKEAVRRFITDTLAQRTPDLVDRYVAPDFRDHKVEPGEPPRGIEDMRQAITRFLTAFPDAMATIEDCIGEGDRVVIRETLTGTNTGPWGDRPPTGKRFTAPGIDIYRLVDGRIAERWGVSKPLTDALRRDA